MHGRIICRRCDTLIAQCRCFDCVGVDRSRLCDKCVRTEKATPRSTPPTPDALGAEEERVAAQVDSYLRGQSNERPMSDAGVAIADLLVQLGMSRADIARMCRERLLAGQKTYGLMRLAGDKRFMSNELVEELLDGLNYCGADTVQAEERGEFDANAAIARGDAEYAVRAARSLAADDDAWQFSDLASHMGFAGNDGRACYCSRCRDDRRENHALRGMLLCPVCGNKRCPRAEWHGFGCSGSNDVGQVGVPIAAALPATDAKGEG